MMKTNAGRIVCIEISQNNIYSRQTQSYNLHGIEISVNCTYLYLEAVGDACNGDKPMSTLIAQTLAVSFPLPIS